MPRPVRSTRTRVNYAESVGSVAESDNDSEYSPYDAETEMSNSKSEAIRRSARLREKTAAKPITKPIAHMATHYKLKTRSKTAV